VKVQKTHDMHIGQLVISLRERQVFCFTVSEIMVFSQ